MRYYLLTLIILLISCSRNDVIPFKTEPCTVVDTDSGAKIVCPDGSQTDISDGLDGNDGSNGKSVVFTTTNITTCINSGYTVLMAIDENNNNVLDLTDSNLQSMTLCNGENATSPFMPVDIIDPCGNHPSKVDEVLLKFSNNQILASFSDNANGLNTRFALLYPGSFITTDGTNCHFSVDGYGNVTW